MTPDLARCHEALVDWNVRLVEFSHAPLVVVGVYHGHTFRLEPADADGPWLTVAVAKRNTWIFIGNVWMGSRDMDGILSEALRKVMIESEP